MKAIAIETKFGDDVYAAIEYVKDLIEKKKKELEKDLLLELDRYIKNVSNDKKGNGVLADVSLPTDKIFKLLESDKYGWDSIRETGSAVQMEIYRDIMRATAEILKGNDL
jgi:hypothetical protein